MKNYRETKDDTLVEMTLLGNESAYEELVTRHQNAVKGTAYKVTGNEFSAEDASQDAFVAAWMHLDSLREREKFGSWVCSIAKNCARQLVTHYQSCALDISLHILQDMELTASDESGLLEQIGYGNFAQAQRDEQLHAAVEALGEKIREAIRLHYFEGLSVAQIAEKLSVPEGTVKWRLCEGRKQLRKEYGVMEQTYNEKESLVERVMRQVEALKMWRLKNDKTGFEQEYRAVLSAVESLEDSKEKHHALADVLLRGYWWLPGEKSDETVARIKEAAVAGHNEDVMQMVACFEHEKVKKGKERIDFMRDTQIPELEKNGFRMALGYTWFWLGCYLGDEGEFDASIEAYRRVLKILTPTEVYYANAQAAIWVTERKREQEAKGVDKEDYCYSATGEVLRMIGGKLVFWEQPGFSRGGVPDRNGSLFWNCAPVDNLMFDPDLPLGEKIISSDGKIEWSRVAEDLTVTTPAGTFEHCVTVRAHVLGGDWHGLRFSETTFCPGVGLIGQKVSRYSGTMADEWQLASYKLHDGAAENGSPIPFAAGNRWEYVCLTDDGLLIECENRFEIIGVEQDTAVFKREGFECKVGYADTWQGNIRRARYEYCYNVNENTEKLRDVEPALRRAAELAVTKRQKVHTAIATDVMHRIFATDEDANPDYTEKGFWNFFDICPIKQENGRTVIYDDNRDFSFEWKDYARGDEGYKVINNFIYDIFHDAAGCMWSPEWVPGYHSERKFKHWRDEVKVVLDVLEEETVTTAAGTFAHCRPVMLDIEGKKGGGAYRGGKKCYWFAPQVGIVKYCSWFGKEKDKTCVYELTHTVGRGAGYFPIADGLVRRYEVVPEIGNGWYSAVEYTFDGDGEGIVFFRNATGVQARANYEEDVAKRKAKEEAKKKEEKEAGKAAEQAK